MAASLACDRFTSANLLEPTKPSYTWKRISPRRLAVEHMYFHM
jgi:hypothetical protein